MTDDEIKIFERFAEAFELSKSEMFRRMLEFFADGGAKHPT